MNPLLVLVTTAALGVEVGWEPLPDGGHEYTIQIEPQLLGVLEQGTEEIASEVPPELNVRRYRVRVGTGQLPRNVGAPAEPTPAQPDRRPPDDNFDNGLPPAWENEPDVAAEAAGDAAGPPDFPSPSDRAAPGQADIGEIGSDAVEPGLPNAVLPEAGLSDPAASAQAPGKLPPATQPSEPIEQAGFESQGDGSGDSAAVQTQKPELPDAAGRPWVVLLASVVLLCCSLGANAYLGWIAWEARHRYRDAIAKLRTAS